MTTKDTDAATVKPVVAGRAPDGVDHRSRAAYEAGRQAYKETTTETATPKS